MKHPNVDNIGQHLRGERVHKTHRHNNKTHGHKTRGEVSEKLTRATVLGVAVLVAQTCDAR